MTEKVPEIKSIIKLDKLIGHPRLVGKLFILKFGASWCIPCQKIKDRFRKLKIEYPDIIFLEIDIDDDDEDNTGIKISDYFDVRNLPTIIIFQSNGNLPVQNELSKIIIKKHEGSDLSPVIGFCMSFTNKPEIEDIGTDKRFEPPNENMKRGLEHISSSNEFQFDNAIINDTDLENYEKELSKDISKYTEFRL